MTWRDGGIVGADSETTGVNVETDRIVTFCVGLAAPTGWTAKVWLLRQSQPIPPEATAVHGITTEHANNHGVDPAAALAEIRDDLYRGWALGLPVCIYNAPYDTTILDRDLRRHHLGGFEIRGPVIDPLVIDKATDKWRKGSRRLVDVAAHHGIRLAVEDAHGAEADALAACRLAWKLGRGWLDLTDLHQWQAEQYAAQRRSFAAHLAKRGEKLDDPSTDWPIRPHTATSTDTA